MNWTNLKVVVLVIMTSVLTAAFTAILMKRLQTSTAGNVVTSGGNPMSITFGAPVDKEGLAKLESQVKARQDVDETTGAITIDLKPHINAALTDPLADAPGQKEHTLARLPSGVHTFGGVPFDVEGLVQLTGPSLTIGGEKWPEKVTNIAIGHPCKKLYLLHGAFNIDAPGAHMAFAKLILHYADGSNQELDLVGGTHALKCTAPAVPPYLSLLPIPQTELGWVGSDPYLESNDPGEALHIYRTTMDNPNPGLSIVSLDYVSTMVHPAPFLAGITIE